ncbi:MAG: transglutaminase-like domain-containing protein [Alphaproteobacteria bacterium]|nr:transglutaminase-like domain-containing protein [Alphaproteobacteria bacterium]
MSENLSDTMRRLYTVAGEFIDSDHPAVEAFARAAVAADAGVRDKAGQLYKAVRDGIRYDPYGGMRWPHSFRASSVLAAGSGYCVGKAALYAALCRVHDIPARLGFADVRNHLTTTKLRESMGTDLFCWHAFTEVYVEGDWRKATPTFNATLCARIGVQPLDFDGINDALLHEFDGSGRNFMEYVNSHGSFHDVPAKFLDREMGLIYAGMRREDLSDRDMEREAAES